MSLGATKRIDASDTIAAVASPPGAGPRAVVRLSGPRAITLALELVSLGEGDPPAGGPSRAGGGAARHQAGHLALAGWPPAPSSVLLFRGPRSYTGEDVAELHVPGAPPLVRAILRALEARGVRTAAPGEFTRRAFLAGRLDLARAEAVLALTRAESDAEARAAARALAGGLARALDEVKAGLLDALAHLEAAIDFPEEDLPGLAPAEALAARATRAAEQLGAFVRGSLRPRVPSAEPTVVLVGHANVGKSSLLNALAGRPAALVSPVAGTTRDPVVAPVTLAPGRSIRLVDTAGEKAASGAIEVAALERAAGAAENADLVLELFELAPADAGEPPDVRARCARPGGPRLLRVGTKSDRLPDPPPPGTLAVSARSGAGLEALRIAIMSSLEGSDLSSDVVQTERQERLVSSAREALARAAALLRSNEPARLELAAVDLGSAVDSLGELTGAVSRDDVLDRIFGAFCIGK